MHKGHRLLAAILALLVALSAPAYAWNNRGHMIVASVAYQHLTQKTKDRVDALLALNPDRPNWLKLIPKGTSAKNMKMMLFIIAATWPDRIKRNSQYHSDGPDDGNRPPPEPAASQNTGYDDFAMHKYWHFIDKPFSQDGTPLAAIPSPNAETQIAAFRAVLASNSPDPLKSYDLSWLLHLVGDVHQPLHCTARFSQGLPNGVAGGNLVVLIGTPNELHAFWDGALGASESLTDVVKAGKNLPGANAGNMDAAAWIEESFQAAQSDVYKQPPIGPGAGPFTITSKYKTAAGKLAKKRVALAGARLAKILNDELK